MFWVEYFKNISYTISHIFLMLFIYLFVLHRYTKIKTVLICFLSLVLLSVTDYCKMNIFSDSNICFVIVTVIQIIVTQFTGLLIAKKRDSRVLFMNLSASNYVIAGSIIPEVVYISTDNIIISLLINILLHLSILLFLYRRIRQIWLQCCEKEYNKSWWELCLIPVFFYCGFSCLAVFPYTLQDNPQNILGVLVFILTMFVSYIVVLRYVESESKNTELYWKNAIFESYIKGLENQYYLVEQSERNLKIMRHDMRHYSGMIDSLLDQGEYENIRKITHHINEVADDNKIVKYCENLIVNTVISRAMEQAQRLEIEMRTDFLVLKEIPVNEYEFASVIANLLENAIDCVRDFAEKRRYVEVKIHCTQEYLLLSTKNKYEKEIQFHPVSGLPKSRKGGGHGLGMQSVSAFCDKISGNISSYCEDEIFHIILFAKF